MRSNLQYMIDWYIVNGLHLHVIRYTGIIGAFKI